MPSSSIFRISAAFIVAIAYTAVGARSWSQPIHEGSRLWLQYLAGVLVYGNLMALVTELGALVLRPLIRRSMPRIWLPLVALALAASTGELAVRSNLDLPPLIGLSDPIRLILLAKALGGGILVTLLLLAIPWLLFKGGVLLHLERLRRPLGVAYGAQLLGTVLWVLLTNRSLAPPPMADSPDAPLRPIADRGYALVCVDAAYWKIIDELIEEGRLPNLERMRDSGTWGHLITYGKRLSPIVWTTLVTGVTVDKHGVAGWTEPSKEGRTIMVPSTSRRAAALWNVADAAGLSSLVLNWLITAPPEKVEGAIVPNLDYVFNGVTPPTHPPALSAAVVQEFEAAAYPRGDEALEPIQKVDLVERIYEMATRIRDYDIVVTGTQATDDVQHRHFLHRYPELFDDEYWEKPPEEMRRFKDTIAETYDRVDALLGRFADDGRAIALVSDHGARPRTRAFAVFNMNALFEDIGVARCALSKKGERSGDADLDASVVFAAGNDAWHNDLAFFSQPPPNAEIPRADLDAIFTMLRSMKVEESEEPLFDEVVDLRDSDGGKRFKRHKSRGAVGVAIMSSVLRQSPRNRSVRVGDEMRPLASYVHVRQNINGSHAPRGVFLFSGGSFPAKGAIDKLCLDTSFSELLRYLIGTSGTADRMVAIARAFGIMDPYSTLDIAPTLLSYMGLPIAADMDGRVMGPIVEGMQHGESSRRSYAALIQGRDAAGDGPSDEENEKIMEQLRALGYVN
ncbi:MAG: hypothetical protein CME06_13685 [Gemmatimonadetes bacterium]|nr:hypothetical protein [Gemmatimonadota bacterium]